MTNKKIQSFYDLGVSHHLAAALENQGITTPFPIQSAAIPDAIAGKDVLGRGQTGSGKTLSFGLPMMTRLDGRQVSPHRPLGLILSPTRELAIQINDVIKPLANLLGLHTQVVAGGMPYLSQIHSLKRGVHILVATPGRLNDLIDKRHVDLSDVEITVLDEADQMADMGFYPVARDILALTKKDGQRLLFSATLDGDVDALVKQFMKNPKLHSLENEKSRAVDMKHYALILNQGEKNEIASQIAAREGRTIFFVKTKHGSDKLAEFMLNAGIPVGVLHGGKTQKQRARVLGQFKDGSATALIATDVAARGIHVDDVSLVVNYDAPQDHKDYLHRAGRTARAGATGVVVTLTTGKQRKGVFGLVKRANVQLTDVEVRPGSDKLIEITGAGTPSGIPVIVEQEKSGRGEGRGRGRGRAPREPREGNFRARREGGGRFSRSENSENSSFERSEAPARESRPARDFDRNDRPARTNREPRATSEFSRSESRSSSSEGSARSNARSSRSEETARAPRKEREYSNDRPARSASASRSSDRPVRSEREYINSDRPARTSERPARADSSTRAPRKDRDYSSDRPARTAPSRDSDRPARSSDRPVRKDREYSSDRPTRSTSSSRSSDRPVRSTSSSSRGSDRPVRGEREYVKSERPARTESSSRSSDRPVRKEREFSSDRPARSSAEPARKERHAVSFKKGTTSGTTRAKKAASSDRPAKKAPRVPLEKRQSLDASKKKRTTKSAAPARARAGATPTRKKAAPGAKRVKSNSAPKKSYR